MKTIFGVKKLNFFVPIFFIFDAISESAGTLRSSKVREKKHTGTKVRLVLKILSKFMVYKYEIVD
jgi:hypothetical protein